MAEGRGSPFLPQGLSLVEREAGEVRNKPVLRAPTTGLTARKTAKQGSPCLLGLERSMKSPILGLVITNDLLPLSVPCDMVFREVS